MVNSIIKPSYHQGFYSPNRGGIPKAPNLWKELLGAWNPGLGVTGGTLFDQSAYKDHGTLTNMDIATDWEITERGYALDFDGGNDYILINNDPRFLFGSGDNFTLSAWVNAEAFGTQRNILRVDLGAARHLWLFRYNDSNQLEITFGNDAGTLHTSTSATTIITAGWHHVVAVVNAGEDNVYLYIDGVEEASDTDTSTAWSTTDDPLAIGCLYKNGVPDEFFGGKIDDVRIWGRAFNPSEVLHLYTKPSQMFELADIPFGFVAVAPPTGVFTPFYYTDLMAGG